MYEMAIDFDETLGAATPNPANEEFLLVQENYKYEFCTTSVSICIKAFDDQTLREHHIG